MSVQDRQPVAAVQLQGPRACGRPEARAGRVPGPAGDLNFDVPSEGLGCGSLWSEARSLIHSL